MNNKANKGGFSSLSDLVSEVSKVDEAVVFDPLPGEKSSPATQSSMTEKTLPCKSEQAPTTSLPSIETVSESNGGGGSGKKWILGIIAVAFVIWLVNSGEQSTKKPSYNPSPSSLTNTPRQSSSAPADLTPDPAQSPGMQYEKPPVGTNNFLSVSKIRWCIRTLIGIEATRDLYSSSKSIDEFNRIIDDYNSRCATYRYYENYFQRAQREVESIRGFIVSEAIHDAKQLGRSNQSSSLSALPGTSINSPTRRPNAQHTREAQQLLVDLGYKPGPVDGLYGQGTADAVKAFQHDEGLTQDGVIDQDLLSVLRVIHEKKRKMKNVLSNTPKTTTSTFPTINSSLKQTTLKNTMSQAEQSQIKSYCSSVNFTPADIYQCLDREQNKLKQSGGRPDLSGLSQAEQSQIKSYCSSVNFTPADIYQCFDREQNKLKN